METNKNLQIASEKMLSSVLRGDITKYKTLKQNVSDGNSIIDNPSEFDSKAVAIFREHVRFCGFEHFSTSLFEVFKVDGKILGLVVAKREISEPQKSESLLNAEKALNESRKAFEMLYNVSECKVAKAEIDNIFGIWKSWKRELNNMDSKLKELEELKAKLDELEEVKASDKKATQKNLTKEIDKLSKQREELQTKLSEEQKEKKVYISELRAKARFTAELKQCENSMNQDICNYNYELRLYNEACKKHEELCEARKLEAEILQKYFLNTSSDSKCATQNEAALLASSASILPAFFPYSKEVAKATQEVATAEKFLSEAKEPKAVEIALTNLEAKKKELSEKEALNKPLFTFEAITKSFEWKHHSEFEAARKAYKEHQKKLKERNSKTPNSFKKEA